MPPPETQIARAADALIARGDALDAIALELFNVHRVEGETDDQLRSRIRATRGTLAGQPAPYPGLSMESARAMSMGSRSYGQVPPEGSYAAARVQADMASALRRDAQMRGLIVPSDHPEVEYIPPRQLASEYEKFRASIQPPERRTSRARVLDDGED